MVVLVFYVLAGLVAVLLGLFTGFLQEAIIAYCVRHKIGRSDVLVWFWLSVAFVVTLAVVYPEMIERCEPTVTCRLIP